MKKIITHIIRSLILLLFCVNCSGGGDGDSIDPNPPNVATPGATTLVFPNNNSECTTGINVSSTESTITFNWNNSSNTDTYQLFVKNLETQTIENHSTTSSEKTLTILKATPYSWYVVSKNATTETAQSTIWKFYNAGNSVSSYAPFPAELVEPALNAILEASTTSALLVWAAEDVDNDIAEYDVFFDTVSPPNNKVTTTSDSSFSVTVSSGSTYYWRIITKDNENNNSESQVFQFSVE